MSTIPATAAARVTVLRNALFADCTNGGVTSTHDTVTLVGHMTGNGRWVTPLENFSPRVLTTDDAPVLLHLKHDHPNGPSMRLIPAVWDEERAAWTPGPHSYMFGGNYAERGDSRIGELVDQLLGARFYGAIAVHDRVEN